MQFSVAVEKKFGKYRGQEQVSVLHRSLTSGSESGNVLNNLVLTPNNETVPDTNPERRSQDMVLQE